MEAKFEDYWEELRNEIISELPSYGNMPQEGIDWIERVNDNFIISRFLINHKLIIYYLFIVLISKYLHNYE